MSDHPIIDSLKKVILPGIINSYSMIFFLNNKCLSVIILLTTFFNFYAGLSGLLAVAFVLIVGKCMHLEETALKGGVYSFNALLVGIGMGSFFDPGIVFFSLLLLAALIALILSVILKGWLQKYQRPFLSIPFVMAFWFVLVPSSYFENLGLTQRNIYWLNELYSVGGNSLINIVQKIDAFPLHEMVDTYLRSISSIFFQNNLVTGLLIAIGLLISSRISFSLSVIGFLSAYYFARFTGSEAASVTFYNIGANYMMVAFAIGGFFIIPSRQSYFWTILLIPLTSLVLLFFSKIFSFTQLPIFSLPFSVVVITFVHFLQMRVQPGNLTLTLYQYYSPETNLYTHLNNKDRLSRLLYLPMHLPFWGEWTVWQGHDGEHTHKGEWGKALDFVIKDENSKTHRGKGLICEDYYCYNKPVLAPADGFVEEIIDNIDDNAIGVVDTVHNWGNSIIIRHHDGLYSQLSHLQKGTFKVRKGDFVKKGDVLASCGNSGRSPEPHLHYQIQATPYVGSKTLDYPVSYYLTAQTNQLSQFSIPGLNDAVKSITIRPMVSRVFDILPGQKFSFKYSCGKTEDLVEEWEAATDALNYKYLYCQQTNSYAYYVNDGFMFYFTSFYGDKHSLLYYFYLSAYKVFLGNEHPETIHDMLPLNTVTNFNPAVWLNDVLAPFRNFSKVDYHISTMNTYQQLCAGDFVLNSAVDTLTFGFKQRYSESTLQLSTKGIIEFTCILRNKTIHATSLCTEI